MIKWVVLAVAAYILYRLFANDFFKKREKDEKKDQQEMDRKVAAGEMVKDPVCGAYVSLDDSITVRDGKKTYHFCSYDCREKFLKQLEEQGRELPGRSGEDE